MQAALCFAVVNRWSRSCSSGVEWTVSTCEGATLYNAQSQVLPDAWAVPGAFGEGLPPILIKAFGFHDKQLDKKDTRSTVDRDMQNDIEHRFDANRKKLYEVGQCHQRTCKVGLLDD